jgi:hypothetical protein
MTALKLLLASSLLLALPAHAIHSVNHVLQNGRLYEIRAWDYPPAAKADAMARANALYRGATLAVEQKKPFFQIYASLDAAARDQTMSAEEFNRMAVPVGRIIYILPVDGPGVNAHNAADVIADLRQVVEDGYFPAAAP